MICLYIWNSDIELMSHLQFHWRKFLGWAEQTHLHGEVDRAAQVQEFNDATQQENEDPNSFYSRLSMLAIGRDRPKIYDGRYFPEATTWYPKRHTSEWTRIKERSRPRFYGPADLGTREPLAPRPNEN